MAIGFDHSYIRRPNTCYMSPNLIRCKIVKLKSKILVVIIGQP